MSNEDVKCSFCENPAFFSVKNLRDDIDHKYCREHFASFLVTGLRKLDQEAFKEGVRRKLGVDFDFKPL